MTETEALTAEIVTFRANPDVDPASMTRAAAAIEPFLRTCDGFVARHLSVTEDGVFTDHLLWSSLASAEAAAARLPREPAAAPFLAAIDRTSVRMGHGAVALRQLRA